MSQAIWGGSTEPCVEIVSAVSDATGIPATGLPPLQRSVDVDALEALVSGDASSSLRVEFEYAGVVVSVDRDGVIALDSVGE